MKNTPKVLLQLLRVQRAANATPHKVADWWENKIRELDAQAPAEGEAPPAAKPTEQRQSAQTPVAA